MRAVSQLLDSGAGPGAQRGPFAEGIFYVLRAVRMLSLFGRLRRHGQQEQDCNDVTPHASSGSAIALPDSQLVTEYVNLAVTTDAVPISSGYLRDRDHQGPECLEYVRRRRSAAEGRGQIDPRGRNLLEHMVHQSASEDIWFKTMLGIAVTENPLPTLETRLGFIEAYARNSRLRLAAISKKAEEWWEGETAFFDVPGGLDALDHDPTPDSPSRTIIGDNSIYVAADVLKTIRTCTGWPPTADSTYGLMIGSAGYLLYRKRCVSLLRSRG